MSKQTAALISIFSNAGLILFKVIAGIMMGSVSVISEAIHSGIDLMASLIAFFSIKKAAVPADDDHAFGHGKFENISGAFEATLIFLAAGLIIYEAIPKLTRGAEIKSLEAGIGVMFISALVNIFVSRLLFRVAKKTDSIALEADAWHLSTDVFTSIGVMVGLVAIRITHLNILDPIIAILVALMIIKASIDLTRKAIHDLVDKSLPEDEIKIIVDALCSYPEVTSYHKLRTRKSGPRREIDIHLQVLKDMPLIEAHNLCHRVETNIKNLLTNAYVTIHIEPKKPLQDFLP
ncbi:MAG: cation diffusion facilitator family transporter [Planctomycetota bacterium]